MFWNKKGKPVVNLPIMAGALAAHTHSMGVASTVSSYQQAGDETCPCCNGMSGYRAQQMAGAMVAAGHNPNYASSYPIPSYECSFCNSRGHFKPTDIMFQPVKLFKMALEKAQEIQKENERKEAERKQRIKDQIMSKLTDEEQEFLNANR